MSDLNSDIVTISGKDLGGDIIDSSGKEDMVATYDSRDVAAFMLAAMQRQADADAVDDDPAAAYRTFRSAVYARYPALSETQFAEALQFAAINGRGRCEV